MPFRLGGDGSDGTIDCIHTVKAGLKDLGIPMPAIKTTWYEAGANIHRQALLQWGERVEDTKDGDIVWVRSEQPTFGFIWRQGCICVIPPLEQVTWVNLKSLPSFRTYRYCPMRSN
jgi:hypothetical protein